MENKKTKNEADENNALKELGKFFYDEVEELFEKYGYNGKVMDRLVKNKNVVYNELNHELGLYKKV